MHNPQRRFVKSLILASIALLLFTIAAPPYHAQAYNYSYAWVRVYSPPTVDYRSPTPSSTSPSTDPSTAQYIENNIRATAYAKPNGTTLGVRVETAALDTYVQSVQAIARAEFKDVVTFDTAGYTFDTAGRLNFGYTLGGTLWNTDPKPELFVQGVEVVLQLIIRDITQSDEDIQQRSFDDQDVIDSPTVSETGTMISGILQAGRPYGLEWTLMASADIFATTNDAAGADFSNTFTLNDFYLTDVNGQRIPFNYVSESGFTYPTANAVPIPAAIWLFGSGFVGLAAIRRRFKK